MYTSHRDNRSGGKSFGRKPSFGGGAPWKKDFHGGERSASFDAICHSCGKDCKVPFRPNGSKPVYCTNCFRKNDDGGEKRFSKPSYGRPEGRSEFGRSERPQGGMGDTKLQDQLREISNKLDSIMDALDV